MQGESEGRPTDVSLLSRGESQEVQVLVTLKTWHPQEVADWVDISLEISLEEDFRWLEAADQADDEEFLDRAVVDSVVDTRLV